MDACQTIHEYASEILRDLQAARTNPKECKMFDSFKYMRDGQPTEYVVFEISCDLLKPGFEFTTTMDLCMKDKCECKLPHLNPDAVYDYDNEDPDYILCRVPTIWTLNQMRYINLRLDDDDDEEIVLCPHNNNCGRFSTHCPYSHIIPPYQRGITPGIMLWIGILGALDTVLKESESMLFNGKSYSIHTREVDDVTHIYVPGLIDDTKPIEVDHMLGVKFSELIMMIFGVKLENTYNYVEDDGSVFINVMIDGSEHEFLITSNKERNHEPAETQVFGTDSYVVKLNPGVRFVDASDPDPQYDEFRRLAKEYDLDNVFGYEATNLYHRIYMKVYGARESGMIRERP